MVSPEETGKDRERSARSSPAAPLPLVDAGDQIAGSADDQASDAVPNTHALVRVEIAKRLMHKGAGNTVKDPLIGTVLGGRFEITEVLGSGGMSVVYKAKQLVVDRFVAIKTLRVQLHGKRGAVERFKREINSLCRLGHPHIVTLYDCIFSEDGQPFVVMDYLKGKSLQDCIYDEGPLVPQRAQKIFMQVASALEHAHRNGVIHRDLKPDNIMLISDSEDQVKVLDFGLAKVAREQIKVTQPGEVWGSPPYMSPEQCMGHPIDARSDIYSLSLLMYEALIGREPFVAKDPAQFMHKHVHETPKSFAQANPAAAVPESFEALVFKSIEKDPDRRFQSMAEVHGALEDVFGAKDSKDSKDTKHSKDPKRGQMLKQPESQDSRAIAGTAELRTKTIFIWTAAIALVIVAYLIANGFKGWP